MISTERDKSPKSLRIMITTPRTSESVSSHKIWRAALITSITSVLCMSEAGAATLAGRTESRAEVLVEHEVAEIKEAVQKVMATSGSTKKEIAELTQKLNSLQLISGTEQESNKPPRGEVLPGLESDFDRFKATLHSVTMYEGEDGMPSLEGKADEKSSIQAVKYYVVEEDLVLDELALLLYHQQAKTLAAGKSNSTP